MISSVRETKEEDMLPTRTATEDRLQQPEPGLPPRTHTRPAAIFDTRKLRAIAKRYDLDLIVLFGSHAKGRARLDSDVDIGVWFEHPPQRMNGRYEREREIRKELWQSVPNDGPEADIVFLNRAEAIVLRAILETGIPLYVRDEVAWLEFRLYANRRYRREATYRERMKRSLRRKYGAAR